MSNSYIKISKKNIEIKKMHKFEVMDLVTKFLIEIIKEDIITKEDFETMSKIVLADEEELDKMMNKELEKLNEKLKELNEIIKEGMEKTNEENR